MEPTIPEGTANTAAEPVAEQKEPQSHSIPKERLDQEIGKRRSVEAELAQARKDLEELKSKSAPQRQEAGKSDGDLKTLQEQVRVIQEAEQRRELQRDLKLTEAEQVSLVQQILKASPDIKPSEALLIAQMRDPEKFGGTDKRGFDPSQHSSLRPNGAGAPKVGKTLKERAGEIAKITNPIDRDRAEKQLHGKIVASLLGWQRPD